MNNNNESLARIGIWIRERLLTLELAIVVLSIAGFYMLVSDDSYAGMLVVMILSSLALIYFFRGYSLSMNDEFTSIEKFFDYLISLAWSVVIMGVLFRLLYWPGFHFLLLAGCSTVFIGLSVMLLLTTKKDKFTIMKPDVILRSLIILALGATLLFTTNDKLIELNILQAPVNIETGVETNDTLK